MMDSSRENVVNLKHGSHEENLPRLAAFRPDLRMSRERRAGTQLDRQPFRMAAAQVGRVLGGL